MFIIDDPLMALILRFVSNSADKAQGDDEFMKRQIKAMKQHIARFPEEERTNRAMEWIGQHAAQYRRTWERNTIAGRTVHHRCPDCPLADLNASEQCEIHAQWLYLLHRYLNDEVTSRGYIEDALALLREVKEQQKLRVNSKTRTSPVKSPNAKKSKKKKKKKKRRDKEKRVG